MSRAEGRPQPYGADLGSAGNYSGHVSREEDSVPGLAGLFVASREAVHPWVGERKGNGFRKRSGITEDTCRIREVGVRTTSSMGLLPYTEGSKTQSQASLRVPLEM